MKEKEWGGIHHENFPYGKGQRVELLINTLADRKCVHFPILPVMNVYWVTHYPDTIFLVQTSHFHKSNVNYVTEQALKKH
jgi:hypothetical protein